MTIFFSALHSSAAPKKVFIFAGQSNMYASGAYIYEIPESLRTHAENIEYHAWNVKPGYDTLVDKEADIRFGPDLTAGHALSAYLPDDSLVFIKYMVGASSQYQWHPEWDSATARDLQLMQDGCYRHFMSMVDSILAEIDDYTIEAMFWSQGEKDTRTPKRARRYLGWFLEFVSTVRQELNKPDLPFIYGRVNPIRGNGYWHVDTVRRQQEMAAEQLDHAILLDIDHLKLKGDGVHIDTEGTLEYGKMFAEAYINNYGTSPVRIPRPLTSPRPQQTTSPGLFRVDGRQVKKAGLGASGLARGVLIRRTKTGASIGYWGRNSTSD